jgi:tetratricopeptide (TPR) repeat protein
VLRTVARVRAELALARGEAAAALEHLRAIPPVQLSTAAADRATVLAEIQRSEAARRAGNVGEALASAERAVAALRAATQPPVPVVEGRALVALGRAQAASGRSDEAIATLGHAVHVHSTAGHPNSLFKADAQIALAGALAKRDPVRARELLSAARAVQAAVGEVGPQGR